MDACVAIASASYRIEEPRIPENRRKIGKNRNLLFFAYFSPISPIFLPISLPIFWNLGFFYSAAGRRDRNACEDCAKE